MIHYHIIIGYMYCFGFRLCCRVMKDHLISLCISCWVLHVCLGKNDLLHLTRNEDWGEFLPCVPVSKGWIVSATSWGRGTITAKKKKLPTALWNRKCGASLQRPYHYRKKYFQVTNLVVNSIYSHFKQPGYTKYTWLESLLLKTASKHRFLRGNISYFCLWQWHQCCTGLYATVTGTRF